MNELRKCYECKHVHIHPEMYPCNECIHNIQAKDHFKPREVKEGGKD